MVEGLLRAEAVDRPHLDGAALSVRKIKMLRKYKHSSTMALLSRIPELR